MFQFHFDHTTHPRLLMAAANLLADLAGEKLPGTTPQVIASVDRPDAGMIPPPVPVPPPAPASWSAASIPSPAGGAAGQFPLPQFTAPFTAAAPAQPTAPGAMPGFSAPPVPAFPSPAQPPVPLAAAPTAAPTGSPAAVELDAKGLPWDGRIHSSGRSKLDNGTWKMKKGVANDLAFVSRIEAELRQVMNMQVPPAPAPQQMTPAAQQWQQQPQPAAPAPMQQPAPSQWQQPPVPQPPAPAPQPQPPAPAPQPQPQNISGPQTFADFNAAVSAATSTGQLSVARLLEVVAELGLPSVPMLQHRPELVPIAWAKLTGQAA